MEKKAQALACRLSSHSAHLGEVGDTLRLVQVLQAYRSHGHLHATLDPLERLRGPWFTECQSWATPRYAGKQQNVWLYHIRMATCADMVDLWFPGMQPLNDWGTWIESFQKMRKLHGSPHSLAWSCPQLAAGMHASTQNQMEKIEIPNTTNLGCLEHIGAVSIHTMEIPVLQGILCWWSIDCWGAPVLGHMVPASHHRAHAGRVLWNADCRSGPSCLTVCLWPFCGSLRAMADPCHLDLSAYPLQSTH